MLSDGTILKATGTAPTDSYAYFNLNDTYKVILLVSSNPNIRWFAIDLIDRTQQMNITVKAVKLELGSVSTLAIDTAPDYVLELVKCQGSTVDSTDTYANQGTNIFNSHNIPRNVPKNITAYFTDGSIWDRLNGTNGYSLYEDLYAGDYAKMSRAISANNPDPTYQLTGTDYVTIAGIDWYLYNGDSSNLNYHHLVMVPGQGFGGTQHFGRSKMNPTNDTTGGYVSSEMNTTVIGAVTSSGSTAATATINQQLYAEFGTHLKTTRELVTNAISTTAVNRFGTAGGAASGWIWTDMQARLMSENEVYGSIAWSSSGYDTGNACRQLPLFAASKTAQNNRSSWYWLADVASGAFFCLCTNDGIAHSTYAGNADDCVRPRFVLGA